MVTTTVKGHRAGFWPNVATHDSPESIDMRHNRSAIFAWIAFFIITALAIATFVISIIDGSYGDSPLELLRDGVWQLVPVTFALVGALIVSHRPRNAIGLLLLLPAFALVIPVDSYLAQFADAPPSNQTLGLLAS